MAVKNLIIDLRFNYNVNPHKYCLDFLSLKCSCFNMTTYSFSSTYTSLGSYIQFLCAYLQLFNATMYVAM